MRCFECGYQNSSDARVCIKCGTKLTSSGDAASPDPGRGDAPAATNDGKKTMVGRSSEAPSWDGGAAKRPPAGKSAPSAGVHRCEKCGYYPLRQPVSAESPCPNCEYTGAASSTGPAAEAAASDAAPTPQPKAKPSQGKTRRLSDFNIGDSAEAEPVIVLTDEKSGKKLAFSGADLSLSRADLDPSNETISSKEHLQVSVLEGKLIVQDKSSNGATFVRATERMQVASGSSIIIGNKIYTIEITES